MRKILLLFVLAILLVVGFVKNKKNLLSKQKPNAVQHFAIATNTPHRIEYVGPTIEPSHCSATAIGPHVLLTASHCEEPSNKLLVDGDTKVIIVKTRRDTLDHSMLFLKGITFKEWANFSEDMLYTGEDVCIYGEPADLSYVYRRGYITGLLLEEDKPPKILMDLNIYFGDSGSGVFDNKGNIIGVITGIRIAPNFKLAYMYPIAFSQKDFEDAQRF